MYNIIEYTKIVLPIVAIGISIISIIISRRNFRRQIRVAKLEEILENFLYVTSNYWRFRILIEDLKDLKSENNLLSEVDFDNLTKNHKRNVEILKKKNFFEKIIIKSNRVGILSNSYLPNGILKLQIISSCRLINSMIESLDSENLIPITSFSINLPNRKAFSRIVEKIEKDIIKEMDLGYKSHKWIDLHDYYKNDFKKELEI